METVASRDGTSIGYERTGSGPPLVLVHGTAGGAMRWRPVMPVLGGTFSVYAIDRRGRGSSGDSSAYAIEREFEDVAAVVDSIGEPVHLLGHSYGAICALEAALLTPNLRSLVLYEPPLPLNDVPIHSEAMIERLEALNAAGDREGLVSTFLAEVVRMPPHELELARTAPAWPARLAAAHTLPRELRAHASYHFQPLRFKHMATPTLLLLGGDSPPFFAAAIAALEAALPNSRVVRLPGQQHIAMDTAPELFMQELLDFLLQPG